MSSSAPRIAIDGHTLGSRAGGNEAYVLGLLEGLQACGFPGEVVLYLPRRGRAPTTGTLNVLHRRLRSRRPMGRLVFEFPAALRRDHPVFAHFQYIGPWQSSCPMTIAIHDTSFLLAPQLLPATLAERLRRTTGWALRNAAAVLVPSRWTARSLLARYPGAANKVFTVPLAPASIFSPQGGTVRRLPDRFCLYVGRRQRRKNIAFLLRVYAAACELEPDMAPLLLLGPRDREDLKLRRLAATLGIADRVILRGYASPKVLAAAYRRAELFCYPCRYEGFGLPLVEALASGCVALVADDGALPETLGDAGCLLPPESPQAWTDALVQLTRDASARNELARRGPDQARRFTWARTAEGFLDAAHAAGIEGI